MSLFAIFDGHGGTALANHVSKHLHRKIILHPLYSKHITLDLPIIKIKSNCFFFIISAIQVLIYQFFLEEGKIVEAITKAHLELDYQMCYGMTF